MSVNRGTGIDWIRGQIEEIESLLINWGSNCINPRPRTKVKKVANIGSTLEFGKDAIELIF
jgi:hypothetical protein